MRRSLALSFVLAALLVGVTIWWLSSGGGDAPVSRQANTARPEARRAPAVDSSEPVVGEVSERRLADPEACLFGKVTDFAGRSLEGATVLVRTASVLPSLRAEERLRRLRQRALRTAPVTLPRVVEETQTDLRGEYAFTVGALAEGEYTVVASAPGKAPRSELWRWSAQSTRVDFVLADGDTISGIVVGPEGEAVAGASVTATLNEVEMEDSGVRSTTLAARAITDPHGHFRLDVDDRLYAVRAVKRGFATAELRQVLPGSEVVISLAAGKVLDGVVRNIEDSQPLPGVHVGLYPIPSSRSSRWSPRYELQRRMFCAALQYATTDENGSFRFSDLDSGSHLLLLERRGFRITERTVVLLDDINNTKIDVVLFPSVVLEGRVTDEDGTPVVGALVVVGREPGASSRTADARQRALDTKERELREKGKLEELLEFQRTRQTIAESLALRREARKRRPVPLSKAKAVEETDAEGRFRIDTLGKGNYFLSVEAAGFQVHRREEIRLEDDQEDVTIVLQRGARLWGRVLSTVDERAAVSGATVVLSRSEEDLRVVFSDESGVYSVIGLAAGESWNITAHADGYATTYLEGVEIPALSAGGGLDSHGFDLHLQPAAVIRGQVADASGVPISHARVRIQTLRGHLEGLPEMPRERRHRQAEQVVATTDGSGRFALDNIPPGDSLQLVVAHPDFREYRSEMFDLTPGTMMEDLEVRLDAGSRIEVWVRKSSGEFLPGIRVRVRQALRSEGENVTRLRSWEMDRSWRRSRRSLADGRVVFSGLDVGRHVVTAAARGFQPFRTTVECREAETIRLAVNLLEENIIRGVIVDSAGAPVNDASVRAVATWTSGSGEPPHMSRSNSDESGEFILGSLGPGPYDLVVAKGGYATRRVAGVEVDTTRRIELVKYARVAGRVVSSSGFRPISQFEIHLRPNVTSSPTAASSRSQRFSEVAGLFRLNKLIPGAYTLEVRAPGFEGKDLEVEVASGESLQGVEIVLEERR